MEEVADLDDEELGDEGENLAGGEAVDEADDFLVAAQEHLRGVRDEPHLKIREKEIN